MTRNFHRWEVDPFFCAAEEVQDSADRLESVYRTWLHVKSLADDNPAIEFHKRELCTALGTAKWQLEDFERAVFCVTVDDCDHGGDDAPSRRKQFVDALQKQVNTVERALSGLEDYRDLKPSQILQLGKKEKDDLELFLCGTRPVLEDNVRNCTSFTVGNPVDEVPYSRLPLDHKDGALPHLSVSTINMDMDVRTSRLNACLSRHDISSSGKPLPDLHKADIKSFCGRRIDEISKPISDPFAENFHSDRVEPCTERINGHPRSASVGSGLNSWKSGSISDDKRERQRRISRDVPSSRSNLWAIFTQMCHTRKLNSGLKLWKDGDANARDSEMLAFSQESHDIEQPYVNSCFGTKIVFSNCNGLGGLASADFKHQKTMQDGLQIWRSGHYALPYSRFVQIASAILVALGLVGFLSFHVSSSSL